MFKIIKILVFINNVKNYVALLNFSKDRVRITNITIQFKQNLNKINKKLLALTRFLH